jgi:hypothetical protein
MRKSFSFTNLAMILNKSFPIWLFIFIFSKIFLEIDRFYENLQKKKIERKINADQPRRSLLMDLNPKL